MCYEHLWIKAKDTAKYWLMFTTKNNEAQYSDCVKAEKP